MARTITQRPDGLNAQKRAKEAILAALREGATTAEAAEAGRVSRTTAWTWRQQDEAFALAYHDAEEHGTDSLEQVARRRAVEGSDTLLIFLLKARRPEKYRDRVDITAKVESVSSAELKAIQAAAAADPDAFERMAQAAADAMAGTP